MLEELQPESAAVELKLSIDMSEVMSKNMTEVYVQLRKRSAIEIQEYNYFVQMVSADPNHERNTAQNRYGGGSTKQELVNNETYANSINETKKNIEPMRTAGEDIWS